MVVSGLHAWRMRGGACEALHCGRPAHTRVSLGQGAGEVRGHVLPPAAALPAVPALAAGARRLVHVNPAALQLHAAAHIIWQAAEVVLRRAQQPM